MSALQQQVTMLETRLRMMEEMVLRREINPDAEGEPFLYPPRMAGPGVESYDGPMAVSEDVDDPLQVRIKQVYVTAGDCAVSMPEQTFAGPTPGGLFTFPGTYTILLSVPGDPVVTNPVFSPGSYYPNYSWIQAGDLMLTDDYAPIYVADVTFRADGSVAHVYQRYRAGDVYCTAWNYCDSTAVDGADSHCKRKVAYQQPSSIAGKHSHTFEDWWNSYRLTGEIVLRGDVINGYWLENSLALEENEHRDCGNTCFWCGLGPDYGGRLGLNACCGTTGTGRLAPC